MVGMVLLIGRQTRSQWLSNKERKMVFGNINIGDKDCETCEEDKWSRHFVALERLDDAAQRCRVLGIGRLCSLEA